MLDELAEQGLELPQKILEWRQVTKLKSTYTDALPGYINPTTKRVHTSYALAATPTGRLSSSEPNLQNIPIRNEEGRKIRRAFVATPGHKLVSADYSQIELRLLAEIADVPALRQAFTEGLDIHAISNTGHCRRTFRQFRYLFRRSSRGGPRRAARSPARNHPPERPAVGQPPRTGSPSGSAMIKRSSRSRMIGRCSGTTCS